MLPQRCPKCFGRTLLMRWALADGGQVETSASVRAEVACQGFTAAGRRSRLAPCGWSVQGHFVGATMSADGTRFTGGWYFFEADGER